MLQPGSTPTTSSSVLIFISNRYNWRYIRLADVAHDLLEKCFSERKVFLERKGMALSAQLDVVLATPDPQALAGLVGRLRAARHRVWEMTDCASVLAFLLDHDADVVIVDSALQGITGMDVVPVVRKIRPVARIIALVDDSSLAELRHVLGFGIYYHSFKPADQDRILEAICRPRRSEGVTSEGSKNG